MEVVIEVYIKFLSIVGKKQINKYKISFKKWVKVIEKLRACTMCILKNCLNLNDIGTRNVDKILKILLMRKEFQICQDMVVFVGL